jgi:hypothetical protein
MKLKLVTHVERFDVFLDAPRVTSCTPLAAFFFSERMALVS